MEQIERLRAEGVEVDDLGNLDLARHQWAGPLEADPRQGPGQVRSRNGKVQR
jgi:hypothetical protein